MTSDYLPCWLSLSLQVAGGLYVLVSAFQLARFVRQYYFPNLFSDVAGGVLSVKSIQKQLSKTAENKKVVPWAIVTGASEGIGLALSRDLARRGYSLVLVARTKSRLDEAAEGILEKYKNVSVKTVSFDFGDASKQDYRRLFNELESIVTEDKEALNIYAALVNNVGVNYDYAQPFTAVDIEKDLSILKVNCESILQLTKFIVPSMKKQRRGVIINLASMSALFPTPLLATYAATKSFAKSFAEGLNAELGGTGVVAVNLTPGMVISRMTSGVGKRPKASFTMVDAAQMARSTLDQINAGNPYGSLVSKKNSTDTTSEPEPSVAKVGSLYTSSGHPNHAIVNSFLQSVVPTGFVNKLVADSTFATYKAAKRRIAREEAAKEGK